MVNIDFEKVLRQMKVFSQKDKGEMFNRYSPIFNGDVIRAKSDIDRLTAILNMTQNKNGAEYSDNINKLKLAQATLEQKHKECVTCFAHAVITKLMARDAMARDATCDILNTYFNTCVRIAASGRAGAEKYAQVAEFAKYALPIIRSINDMNVNAR